MNPDNLRAATTVDRKVNKPLEGAPEPPGYPVNDEARAREFVLAALIGMAQRGYVARFASAAVDLGLLAYQEFDSRAQWQSEGQEGDDSGDDSAKVDEDNFLDGV